MDNTSNIQRLEQTKLESLRRIVFGDAYQAGSRGWSDIQELQVLNSLALGTQLPHLRDVISFLEGLNLVSVDKRATEWKFKITAYGSQVWEGNESWPRGITERSV